MWTQGTCLRRGSRHLRGRLRMILTCAADITPLKCAPPPLLAGMTPNSGAPPRMTLVLRRRTDTSLRRWSRPLRRRDDGNGVFARTRERRRRRKQKDKDKDKEKVRTRNSSRSCLQLYLLLYCGSDVTRSIFLTRRGSLLMTA